MRSTYKMLDRRWAMYDVSLSSRLEKHCGCEDGGGGGGGGGSDGCCGGVNGVEAAAAAVYGICGVEGNTGSGDMNEEEEFGNGTGEWRWE